MAMRAFAQRKQSSQAPGSSCLSCSWLCGMQKRMQVRRQVARAVRIQKLKQDAAPVSVGCRLGQVLLQDTQCV